MDIIITFVFFIIIVFVTVFLISRYRNKRTSKILLHFQKQDLKEIEIKVSQTTYTGFKEYGGLFSKAKLYFDSEQKILILTTNRNSMWSILNNNLPLILLNKKGSPLQTIYHYKRVDEIIFRSDEYILIIKDKFSKSRTEMALFSEKNDLELRNLITAFNT